MVPVERKVKRYEYVPVERYTFYDVGRLFIIQRILIWKPPKDRVEWY